ncbi:MarR family transcriptional regulator [Aliiroseovarius subalbicans]|uniref:MarR family transcriptional regulator n=1 Tax=Aliiroseovarius subalbicans TaxID=2925840 RepID=UPI001F5AC890|nr:MarR family transcriptional regulator [Aliiroseovarius subalbicans]MCI2400983.1 MarR family transcriptional regulator [Aliiroseovarius subalbicans]
MDETANIEPELLESLRNSLATIPGAQLGEISWQPGIGGRLRPDAVLDAVVADHDLAFVVETRGDVYPRDAREIVWQLKRYLQELDNSNRRFVPMILARSVSEGARNFLQDERVAYHDLSGSLFISDRDTFVLIERPKPKRAKRRDVSVFKGTRAQVLHVLFNHPGEWVTGSEIAEYAGVSPATVSETFRDLERRDWLDVRGEGPAKRRRLIRPDVLLDAWRDSILASRASRRSRYYVPRMKPEDMAREIERENYYDDFDLEFTGQFAAQAYAPFLSNVSDLTVRAFGKRTRDWLISTLGAREVSEGANLVVIDGKPTKRHHRMHDEKERLLASPLQVYLDLLEDHGRSKEMAEHLRSQKLVWR